MFASLRGSRVLIRARFESSTPNTSMSGLFASAAGYVVGVNKMDDGVDLSLLLGHTSM